MKGKYFFLIAIFAILTAGQQAVAQLPRSLTIQGVLTDSTSRPIPDGIHTITLRMYDKLIGGNVVYTEEYTTPVFKGLFNLTLGAKSPLPASIVFDKQYFVGISYNGHSEIARIPFSSVPYSIMAETVPDGSITTSKIADGSITPEKLSFDFRSDKKANTGLANSATGAFAFIGGGNNNIASGNYSSIIGGLTNKAQGAYSTAAGGNNNTASASYSTVSGGQSNTASGTYSLVSGGQSNTASGANSLVSGGQSNSSTGAYSTVGGGQSNTASAASSLVSGGSSNTVSAANSVVGGGSSNNVSGVYSVISGGTANNVSGTYSNIGGGRSNTVSSSYSGVFSGYSNLVTAAYSSILTGYDNSTAGDHSVILGGYGLTLTSDADRTLGFLANSGSRSMIISDPMVTVLGNTDVWIASNDGTTRALKLFSNNMNASGTFPSTVSKNVAIKAPDTLSADYTLTLPYGTGTAGQVLSTDGSGVLSWSAAGASGSAGGDLTGTYPNPQIASGVIINSDINAAAAIAYSKLDLASSIVNADVNSSAAIDYSKLNLSDGIIDADVNSSAGITYSKLNLAGGIVDADVNGSAAIDYSKLSLTDDIVNADVNSSAAIAYSKLNLNASITNADIVAAAGIPYSKLTLTNSIQNGDIVANAITTSKVANGTVTTSKMADSAISGLKLLTSAVTTGHINNNAVNGAKIAMGSDATGDVLYYDGTDYTRLAAATDGNVLTLASGIPSWAAGGASGSAGGDLTGTYPNPTIANDAVTSAKILDGTIVNADINGSAAITYSKLSLANSIQNADIVANAITTSKVANGTVTTSKLADSAVSGLKLLTSAVTTGHINDNAVNGAKIAMGSDASGDIMYYDGTDYVRLPAGSNTNVLTLASGIPSWAAPSGGTVTTNSTLTGNGSGGSPLGINLGNSNTWTANQTFGGTFLITANSRIAMTNSDNNSKDLRIQEPSGTGSQYIGIRCPSVTNNGNYLWPSAVGSVGQAMTISYSNGIDSAYLSWSSFLASGTSAGGDLTGTYPNPTIADNAVSGAKIAMGSDATGDVMYYNGTDYTRRAIGSNGDVLTVSGGVPTWAAPSGGGGGLAVDLLATKTSAQSLATGGAGVTPDDLLFDNVVTSPTVGSYNSGTSVYTVGATGLYMITVNVSSTSATAGSSIPPQLLVNGTTVVVGVGVTNTNYPTNFFHRGELTTVVSLTAGDLVKIKCVNQNTGSTTAISIDGTTRLSIMKF